VVDCAKRKSLFMTESTSRISLNESSLRQWNKYECEKLRYQYDLKPEHTVIDLGAYQGEWANEIWRKYRCKMIVVEPTEYILGFQHGEIINKAAATHEGVMSFGGRAYYTSIMEDCDHAYPCFDVNPLIEMNLPVALLKINIEGAEYDVLEHIIGAGLHKQVKNIQVQFHEIAGRPYEHWYKEIEKKLSLTHERTWCYPFVWENWKLKDA
jgi:FkbM family methyltransferase